MGGDQQLSERVERLLRPQAKPGKPVRELVPLITGAGALTGLAIAVMTLWPGSLSLVHQLWSSWSINFSWSFSTAEDQT